MVPDRAGAGGGADSLSDIESLRIMLDHAPMATGVIGIGPEGLGRFLYVNRAACALTGYDEQQLRSMTPEDLTVAEDRAADLDQVQALLEGRLERSRIEKRMIRGDGEIVWVQVDRCLVRDEAGRPRYVVGQQHHIGERHRRTQLLECERVVARVLAESVTGPGAVAASLPGLAEVVECDAAFAWMPDPATHALRCEAVWSSQRLPAAATVALSREIRLGPGVGLPGRVWESGTAASVEDMSADPSCPRAGAAATDGLHAGVALPVVAGTKVLGVIELLSQRPHADPGLLDVLETVGQQLGAFLARRDVELADASSLLLVEDDDFIATLVQDMLAGVEPQLAISRVRTLEEAREQALASQPACILLDLTLPDADGLQALLALRKLSPEIAIVVLTGHEDEGLAVRAVQEGAQDYLVKRKVDMDGLARSIRYALERKRTERRVFEDVLHDRLTGLANRTLLLDRVRIAGARARGESDRVALLLLDLDRFRRVNDSLGHRSGDRVIVEVAQRLSAESGDPNTVAALGADHFAVLCESLDGPHAAAAIAERLVAAVRRPFDLDGVEVRVDATVGIALYDDDVREPDELLHEAEAARRRARERNASFDFYDKSARGDVRERMDVESGLRRALEEGELRVVYQPIVSLSSGRISACEALLRWEHPERGLLAPGAFISVAEESGLIVPVGEWVLAEACRQLAAWKEAGVGGGLRVNVNLSPAQVCQPQLAENVAAAIVDGGVDPADVCLEITESSLMDAECSPLETLEALKALGVTLALDDFGTGYSSLGYLRRYPIDELKADRSLVTGLGADDQLSAIVTAIVQMGNALGMPVVGEGVETAGDIERLRALGCERAQGYHLARPLPVDEVTELLGSGRDLRSGTARA